MDDYQNQICPSKSVGVKSATVFDISCGQKARLTGLKLLGKLRSIRLDRTGSIWCHSYTLAMPSCRLSAWPAYLMDAKVGIRVEVVVPRCHFLRAEELGDLASAGTVGQGRYMRCMGDAGHMVGSRHWFRQWGGLG